MSENQTKNLTTNEETPQIKPSGVSTEGEHKENLDVQPSSQVQDQPSSVIEKVPTKQQVVSSETSDKSKPRFVARLRGLPWVAREKEIREFFRDEKITEVQVVFLPDGRASGEALVEFETLEDFQSGSSKNRQNIGHRYVEIFKASAEDIDRVAGRVSNYPVRPNSLYVIRMRGLPYEATENDIRKFFDTLSVKVHLVKDDLGRPSGEGFIELSTEEDLMTAMTKHRQNIGRRYIELFRSSPEELLKVLEFIHTANPYGRKPYYPQNNTFRKGAVYHTGEYALALNSNCLLMRGLPYSCTEADITKFFQEVQITPVRIHRKADGAEAYVEFYSASECSKAMTRHKSFIGSRYIELFRVTYESMAQTVGLPLHQQRVVNPMNGTTGMHFQQHIPRDLNTSQNFALISNTPQIRTQPPSMSTQAVRQQQQLYNQSQTQHLIHADTGNPNLVSQGGRRVAFKQYR